MLSKPKVLRDLYCKSAGKKISYSRIVNLNKVRFIKIPLKTITRTLIVAGLFSYLIFGSVLAPAGTSQLLLAAQNSEEERQALEKQLQDLESQIADYQTTVDKYKSQGKDLQGEIDRLNAKIGKLNLQVKAVTITLQKLDGEIVVNKDRITGVEQDIEQNRVTLIRILQNIHENENLSVAEILLRRPRLSDFFADISDLINIQEGLRVTLEKILGLRSDLLDEKEALAIRKNDAEELRVYQESQKAALSGTKSEKGSLLQITKGNEAKYQSLLKETQKTAAQIRSRIFELLGGGELTFEQAYQFAKFAEQSTGIRSALVLAVLDRESALGQNVGKCGYKTAMHPTRDTPVFLGLLNELNINPDTVTVSCPNRDGLYGGAMGPAQFIPSTWNLYKDKVSEVTGSKPPSPWRNGDAFVATALYLQDSMRGCNNIYSRLSDRERCAAAKYYAGARWRRHLWGYGDRVVTQAQQFQSDIDILNS